MKYQCVIFDFIYTTIVAIEYPDIFFFVFFQHLCNSKSIHFPPYSIKYWSTTFREKPHPALFIFYDFMYFTLKCTVTPVIVCKLKSVIPTYTSLRSCPYISPTILVQTHDLALGQAIIESKVAVWGCPDGFGLLGECMKKLWQ